MSIPETHRREAWWRRHKALTVLVVLMLVGILVVAGYLWYLNRLVSGNITHDDLLPRRNAAGDVILQESKPGVENILLIGSDAKPSEPGARSDVIIIAQVSADREHVHLVHFPRDLYVDVPGFGPQKLNGAFEHGGAPLLVRVLQNMLGGTKIDRVAIIGFESFSRMTDVVGGVVVRSQHSIRRWDGVFEAGVARKVDGREALRFVRERKQLPGGDVSRGEHQMVFLQALAQKVLKPAVVLDPRRLGKLLDAATREVVLDRDTSVGDLRGLAFGLRGLRAADITPGSAPFASADLSSEGRYIVLWDSMEMLRLGKALREDTMDELELPERTLTRPPEDAGPPPPPGQTRSPADGSP